MPSKYDDYSEEEMAEAAEEFQEKIHLMEQEVQKGYIGQEDVIHKILLCVAAGGNILLEGVPGLGKSFLVETLARVVEGAEMHRIQFTPDKLPSDIVGTEAYNEDKGFYVEKGPIFGNFILADEINRAPPKVQSAMLEAMQEHKVSIGDETFHLPEPFFTMATQNPVEQGGSLHPEETIYINGKIQKAEDALENAKENGELVHEDEDKRIYDADVSTNNLNTDGEITDSECMVYEKDYSGEMFTITTKTGRSVKVNADHPLLVNDGGHLTWKKAEELEEDDFIVNPETLELPEEEFKSHDEALEGLGEDFDVYTRQEVKEALDRIEDGFQPEDVNCARVACELSKKELAEKTDESYDRCLNYLQGLENGMGDKLAEALREEKPEIGSFVESFNTHRISDSWSTAEAGFFIGFTLAEGCIEDNSIEVSQKNYPELIERWIDLGEKMGLEVNTRMKEDVKHAKIRSKPFVKYLRERYNLGRIEELLSAPKDFKQEFLDAFMLAESYFEEDFKENNTRITMTQKDEKTVNTIAYMFADFGIRPKIYDEGRVYRLRISDKDLHTYIEKFTWPQEKPILNEEASAYRKLPVDAEMIDELVTKLGFKQCGEMKQKEWYSTYTMAKKRGKVSEYGLRKFIESMKVELERRKSQEPVSIKEKAHSVGIPMTEIVEETALTKHRVWQAYKGEKSASEAEEFIERETEVRLEKAGEIINYLEKLVENDVFYDPIKDIEVEKDYDGNVIGLSVPETHNYVAGTGGCGINHNTYPLPEAQIDRFLFKIYLDYPKKKNEQKIIDMNANIMDEEDFDVGAVVTEQDVKDIQEFSQHITVSEEIKAYIVDLVDASRNPEDYGLEYSQYIDWGCTPRASINLALAGRANALYNGRHYVTPEDIRSVIKDVFIHRIILNYEGEAKGLEVEDVIQNIVDRVPVR
ncbi:MAG: AAA family ATPase [Candidatus Nanohalobium sp.]